jgi:hypothetical protein
MVFYNCFFVFLDIGFELGGFGMKDWNFASWYNKFFSLENMSFGKFIIAHHPIFFDSTFNLKTIWK